MNIPKTLVIGINMHGEIHLKEDGLPNTGIIPPNMYINIINAVVPGVPNISTLENYEKLAEDVSENIKDIPTWNQLTKQEINSISENIKNLLVTSNKDQADDIMKEYQKSYNKGNVDAHFKRFTHSYDNSFKITEYESGSTIPDKLYLKFQEGEVLNIDEIDEKYFNKIVIYNLEGEPDIFELLQVVGVDIDQITTLQLIDFLSSMGVENMIIIDLSCSVFKGDPKYLSERNIRYTRRTMQQGGKKVRHINKKSKSKKSKSKSKKSNTKK